MAQWKEYLSTRSTTLSLPPQLVGRLVWASPRHHPRERPLLEVGQPRIQRMLERQLHRMVPVPAIGIVQRHGTAHRFEVVAATSAGARIDPQTRNSLQQLIPELKVSLDMQVLIHPLTILALVGAPVFQWWEVVVLPVYLDAAFYKQPAHVVGKPLAALRVAQVQQAVLAVYSPQQPCRVFRIESGAGSHSFRLKPNQQVGAVLGRAVRHRPEAIGMPSGVRFPGARYRPLSFSVLVVAVIPPCVDQPDVKADSALFELVEMPDLSSPLQSPVGPARASSPSPWHAHTRSVSEADRWVWEGCGRDTNGRHRFAALETSPVQDSTVYPWCSDAFSWLKPQVRLFLARPNMYAVGQSRKTGSPVRASDGHRQTAALEHDAVVGECAVAGPAAVGGKAQRVSSAQRSLQGGVSFLTVEVAIAVVQNGRGPRERSIHGEDVADHRRGLMAFIGKPCHPLHHRVVLVLRALDLLRFKPDPASVPSKTVSMMLASTRRLLVTVATLAGYHA